MGRISYNDSKINGFVQEVNSLSKVLEELNIDCKSTIEMIVNARGFNQYISNVDNNCFDPYFEECSFSIKGIAEKIRFMQSEILLFNDDKDSIKFFLNSLSEEEILNSSDELKSIYSKMVKETSSFFERTGATIFTSAISAIEGILDLGETLIDLGDIVLTGAKSIFASCYDLATGKFNGEDSSVKKMFEDCKARVSKKTVESIFDSFYDNNEFGRSLKDKSYFFDQARNISKGIVQSMGIVGVGVFTGGAGLAAGSLSAGRLATVAGTIAMSTNTEDAWANGASVGDGLKRGLVGAVWDGAQWFVGAKIGVPGGYGDKFAQNIFKSTSKGAVAVARIGLDAVDSGLEGFVQPLLDLMYKDSYVNENGETVKFDASMTFADKYREAFDDAGGMNNVLVQGAIGAGGSAIGEISDMTQLLKAEGEGKLDLDAGAKTAAGATGLSLIDRVKNIFKSDVDANTRVDTDINLKNTDVDVTVRDVDADVDGRLVSSIGDDIEGADIFDGGVSGRNIDVGDEKNVFALEFLDNEGNVIEGVELDKTVPRISRNALEINEKVSLSIYDALSDNDKLDFNRSFSHILNDLEATGSLSDRVTREIVSSSPKVTAACVEALGSYNGRIGDIKHILSYTSPEKIPGIVELVLPTKSSMVAVNCLTPQQMADCMTRYVDDSVKFNDFTCKLSDAQLGRTFDILADSGTAASKRSLKKALSMTGSYKTQRLIDYGYSKHALVDKLKPNSFFGRKVDINDVYSRVLTDVNEAKVISADTRTMIGALDAKNMASLVESSFGLNSPRAVFDVIDSIDYKKLGDVYSNLSGTPYEKMFVERLTGRQAQSVLDNLHSRNIVGNNFVSNLSDVQVDACLKRLVSSGNFKDFDVKHIELLMQRMDSSQIDYFIDKGYLDTYFDGLNKSQLKSSVLSDYVIFGDKSFESRSLITSKGVKAYNDLTVRYFSSRQSSTTDALTKLFVSTDKRTTTAFLKNLSSNDFDVNCVVKLIPDSKLQDAFGNLYKNNPAAAVDFMNRVSVDNRAIFVSKLTGANSKVDFDVMNTFLKQLDDDGLGRLIETGCLDKFANSLKESQIENCRLNGRIYNVFSDNLDGTYKKRVLLSERQLKVLGYLDSQVDDAVKTLRFSTDFLDRIKKVDDSTIIKLLDVSRSKTGVPNLPSQIFDRLSPEQAVRITNRLMELDDAAAKNILGNAAPYKLKSVMTSSSISGNSYKFDRMVSYMSGNKVTAVLDECKGSTLYSDFANRLAKTADIDNYRKYVAVAKDKTVLSDWISSSSDAELSKTLNYLSRSRLTEGRGVAARILKSVPTDRVNSLIDSGSLKYNYRYDYDVRTRISADVMYRKQSIFETSSSVANSYGVDQAVSRNLVSYDIKQSFIDDLVSFREYLMKEKGYDAVRALEYSDAIVGAKKLNHDSFAVVKDYLVTSSGYSPERLMEINRTCFEKKMSYSYERLYTSLSSRTYNAVDARRIIDCINSTGTCSYANVANIIVDSYKTNVDAFERDFGFPLYTKDAAGNDVINSTELITDMYVNINSNKFGGSLFSVGNNGKISIVGDKIDTSKQIGLSARNGYRHDIIDKYLKSKNPNLEYKVTTFKHAYDGYSYGSTPISSAEMFKQNTINNLSLNTNNHASLGIYASNNKQFRFMELTDDGFKEYISTVNWSEGGAHAVKVTGWTEDHIIVSSWGKKLYIPFSDFEDNYFNISYSSIGGIK